MIVEDRPPKIALTLAEFRRFEAESDFRHLVATLAQALLQTTNAPAISLTAADSTGKTRLHGRLNRGERSFRLRQLAWRM